MFEMSIIIELILLGVFVGLISGLFGIGGGGIIVPVLSAILLNLNFNSNLVVHTAIGTSMAIMAITLLSSSFAQYKKQAIVWDMFKALVPSIIIGVFLSTFIVTYLNSFILAIIFATFMFFTAINMFFGKKPNSINRVFTKKTHLLSGTIFGVISALISVAGGMFIVPYLIAQGINMKKAVGTSTAIGLPLTLCGAIGYMINGWDSTSLEVNYLLGFVYLPAVLLVSVGGVITAPIGVKLSHYLPGDTLKRIFSIIPFFLSIKLIYELI